MVSDSNLLNKSTIVYITNPKKVLLPNGDVSLVTHTGASSISAKSTVTNDLFTGKVREIGKEERGLYILLTKLARNNNRDVCAAKELTTSEANKINVELWHQRFGHVSILVLKRILSVSLQSIKHKVDKYLWGPYRVATFDGNKYFLIIVDDYNRMTWVFLLKQKLPSSVIENLSPYERLHKRKPSLKHLRVLGCLCFAKIIQEQDKLMPRSKKSVHMRYSEVHKGYILYDLDNISSFVNRDVIFREDIFPFKGTLSSVTPLFVDTTPSTGPYIDDTNIVFETSAGQQTNNHINMSIEGEIQVHQNTQNVSTRTLTRGQSNTQQLPVRKSNRDKQPPAWMKDFVSLNIHQEVPYALNKYIGYDHLSPKCQAFIAAFSSTTEPTTYVEASKDPR
ncbi:uncharacterized protein LOC142167843 [Nicotiana tabacum]|uniref:Uncharacterized protein LOC142167843 n=1 Tax=Nicotiana tabacum TaxID=4097 RepID=A0AC58SGN7_TOBAC